MEPIEEMLISGWVDFYEWRAFFLAKYQEPLERKYKIPCVLLFRFEPPQLVQLQDWNDSMPSKMKSEVRIAFQKSGNKDNHQKYIIEL